MGTTIAETVEEMVLNPDEVKEWVEFLQDPLYPTHPTELIDKPYHTKILELADKGGRSLFIDYWDINRWKENKAEHLIHDPDHTLLHLKKAIKELLPADAEEILISPRIINFPTYSSLFRVNTEIGQMVSLDVMVRKVRQKYPLCVGAIFRCNKCGYQMYRKQEYHEGMVEPITCDNENCKRESNTSFTFMQKISEFVDAEDITIEDPRDEVLGPEPYQMLVLATDDLTQKILPGQRIRVNGIMRVIPKFIRNNKRSLKFGQYIQAHSFENLSETFDIIKITDKEIKQIKDFSKHPDLKQKIKRMICPYIFGHDNIKEALTLFLFAGVEKYDEKGLHIRGDFHILLIGDPGLGKSQMLKYMSKIAPKGIYASGKSSTKAGLTTTALKEEDGWVIEAGVLPQADRGIACIDELDKMRDDDRNSIHEALEQQTISGSKAGVYFELQARCGILGAANPKEGRFNPYKSILEQVDLDHVLLSRFALIYPMEDHINEENDYALARYILDTTQDLKETMPKYKSNKAKECKERLKLPMSLDLFIKYVAYAKQHVNPSIPEEIREALAHYYREQRKIGLDDREDGELTRIPLTTRQIEDLTRLVEASARMRLADTATYEDFEHAVGVFQSSLNLVARDSSGRLDIDIILTGASTKVRSKLKPFMDLLREMKKNYDIGIPIDIIELEVVARDIMDKNECEKAIELLCRKGELITTSNNEVWPIK